MVCPYLVGRRLVAGCQCCGNHPSGHALADAQFRGRDADSLRPLYTAHLLLTLVSSQWVAQG